MAAEKLLVPLEKYLSSGVHVGTKFKTKSMASFIYKTNPAGLAVLNIQKIDERLDVAAKFLAKFDAKDILVVCRRENGWKAANTFAKLIGAKCYTGRYPAGILTNQILDTFVEPKVILITDSWPDKNATADAKIVGIPIVALCDSNNTTQDVDLAVPCNNKGANSLGLVYWILTNQYLRHRGILQPDKEIDVDLKEFCA